MCGLIGLVHTFDPAARLDPAPLRAGGQDLTAWRVAGPEAAADLLRIARALEPVSLALVGWAGFRSLREQPELIQEVATLGGALQAAAEQVDAHLADVSQLKTSKQSEDLASAAVVVRDVAWRMLRDALPNLESARLLLPDGEELSDKGWFELWRINLILNQLERLEVRGRDSGGLATLIRLPRAALAALAPELLADLERRVAIAELRDGAVLRIDESHTLLAFAHKVAKEVGELGANVRDLRHKLVADPLWRAVLALEAGEVQVLAHTRWASNGIINEPNCHPVANDLADDAPLERVVLGVLNGDVDNYPTLRQGWAIPTACTTDAKIIPLEIAKELADGQPLSDGFRAAAARFEGSTAIAALASDDPGCVHVALRGSGQAVYLGALNGVDGSGGTLFASELYGVVELAPRFYKLNGERGEVIRVGADGLTGWDYDGQPLDLGASVFKPAPIATRDIDRGGFPHFFLKEINDSPRSVERTIRGKFVLDADSARFLLGDDVVPARVRAGLAEGLIRRVFVIGQGTAAVAGMAAAEAMARVLRPAGIDVRGMPATDLSGFYLDRVGPDTLVVAVSQSGTTTDTNRTVDLVRGQGAHVIAIVNRRGSDLSDKAHGVLYTSDGRDVEMSVASTKAFYCQVVAGYLLGLCLADMAGAIAPGELRNALLWIQDLPRCLRTILEESRDRARAAAQMAMTRRHWTVVGSGPMHQAAREIRIKLSELCYKSVSVDTIEDKKHIDLSSEPLILVCAAGLTGAAAADAVKEVAIFKAHAAIPIVICDRGETRFAEYAAATIQVPSSSPEVALLLNTIAGHLFSYEAARAIDVQAEPLREIRDKVEAALDSLRTEPDPSPSFDEETLIHLRTAIAPAAGTVIEALESLQWEAGLGADGANRLVSTLRAVQGRATLAGQAPPSPAALLARLLAETVRTIDQLRRPIDAIKHQAKTVTVGISRAAEATRPPAGPLVRALEACGVDQAAIADQDAAALASLDVAIEAAEGVVHYRLEHLSPLGAPVEGSRIKVARKTGVAEALASRADDADGALLQGTKRALVRAPRVWVGHGQRDGRSLVLCPLYADARVSGLGLIHVRFRTELETRERVRAFKAVGRYEDLRCAVTEWDDAWTDEILNAFTLEELLTTSAERLSERLREQRAVQNGAAG